MFEQIAYLESQHYSRQLISNAIMNRLQSLFLIKSMSLLRVLTIVAALGAGEAHACTRSAHAHAVVCCISCVYLSASLLGSSLFDLDSRL